MSDMRSATIGFFAATIAFAGVLLPASSASADASPWEGDARSAVRLVSGGAQKVQGDRTMLRAGVEIRLAPGWKTYWRYPGDSGIPPHFDFSKSENVKSVDVAWPAPQRFADADGVIIGYRDKVLFPLSIEPKLADKPVTLRLALDYAICEKVCIPVHANAELKLNAGGSAEKEIAAAEKTIPRVVPLGADAAFAVKAFRRDNDTRPARVLVDIAVPAGRQVIAFAEGPSADWALPVPEKIDGAPAGQQRFAFALDGLPPGASAKGAVIKLTAIAGPDAIETTFRLD
jgi:DsbC/DsbD-like thiol-disulfide interchange protein